MAAVADADLLGGLKELYLKQLKERLAALEQAMVEIKLGLAGADAYQTLQFEVHRLNGTGATYGFPAISVTAERLERHLGSPERDPAVVVRLLNALMKAITETLSLRTATAPGPGAAPATPKPHGPRTAYKPAVLAADDDPAILNLLQQLLSPWVTVECAQNGRETLAAMERRRFDLVILDYELPDMSGLDVLMQAGRLESGPGSPVMMLSAMSEPEKVSRLIAAGAQNYLVKPVTPGHLVERVSALLSRRKKIVMVADDDPLIREILRKRLTQRGHEVVLANNGAQALAMARKLHPQQQEAPWRRSAAAQQPARIHHRNGGAPDTRQATHKGGQRRQPLDRQRPHDLGDMGDGHGAEMARRREQEHVLPVFHWPLPHGYNG